MISFPRLLFGSLPLHDCSALTYVRAKCSRSIHLHSLSFSSTRARLYQRTKYSTNTRKTHLSTRREIFSAMARTKTSVLTDPSYVLSRPGRDKPCGHALHPAVTDYHDPQCPYCRMVNAMIDLRRASDKIKARGGVHEWHEECEYDFQRRVWERATTGGSRKLNLTPTRDVHGNNSSYRSAKARLHNFLIILEDISVKEQAWEIELPAKSRLRSAIGRLEGKE
jgi:hypothetical protein